MRLVLIVVGLLTFAAPAIAAIIARSGSGQRSLL